MRAPLISTLCVLGLVFAGFAGTAGASAAPPDACTGAVNNSTIQSLCDRVETLQTENSNLEANVTELEGEVEKLQYDLNHSRDMESVVKSMGMVYKNNEPKVVLLRLNVDSSQETDKKYGVFYFAGPGRGSFDLNNDGIKEYSKASVSRVGDGTLSPIKVTFPYTKPGMNKSFVMSPSNAESELKSIQERMNDGAGVGAYSRWVSNKEQQASQASTMNTVGIGGVGAVVGGVVSLAGLPVVRRLREKRRVKKNARRRPRRSSESRLSKLKNLFGGEE